MSTQPAVAGPISRPAAAAALGLVIAVLGLAAIRSAGTGDMLLTSAVVLALSTPLWIVSSMLAVVVAVDGDKLRRDGWGRSTELRWEEVRRVTAWRGMFGLTGIAVHGRWRKVSLSSAMPGFAAAAVVILAEASERGLEVRTPWGATARRPPR